MIYKVFNIQSGDASIVFYFPKNIREKKYGQFKADIGEILRKHYEQKRVGIWNLGMSRSYSHVGKYTTEY